MAARVSHGLWGMALLKFARILTLRFLYSGPPFVILVGRVTSRDTTTLAKSPSKDTAVLADIGPIYPYHPVFAKSYGDSKKYI